MNLPFTRHIGGKETYFPEKIIAGLDIPDFKKCALNDIMAETIKPTGSQFMRGSCNPLYPHVPKLHTFRENLKGTWKQGVMIDFIFWSGRPYWSTPVRFAPRIPVMSTQFIQVMYDNGYPTVFIGDDRESAMPFYISDEFHGVVYGEEQMGMMARNDGFESVGDFFTWFNKDFNGSIIHWTDLRY